MPARPESVSVAFTCTVTGPLCQPAGASLALIGAVLSTRTIVVWVASALPTPSTDQKATEFVPSAEIAKGET